MSRVSLRASPACSSARPHVQLAQARLLAPGAQSAALVWGRKAASSSSRKSSSSTMASAAPVELGVDASDTLRCFDPTCDRSPSGTPYVRGAGLTLATATKVSAPSERLSIAGAPKPLRKRVVASSSEYWTERPLACSSSTSVPPGATSAAKILKKSEVRSCTGFPREKRTFTVPIDSALASDAGLDVVKKAPVLPSSFSASRASCGGGVTCSGCTKTQRAPGNKLNFI
mmetsp:Transcript_10573/g.33508  ORF Transcript_10573/g.33508 Transcript_10573/m.33508 type:complete len:229 (-) Transcript_10573:17-703(-)